MRPAQARQHRSDIARLTFAVCAGNCGTALAVMLKPHDELMHATDAAGWRWDLGQPFCPRCQRSVKTPQASTTF